MLFKRLFTTPINHQSILSYEVKEVVFDGSIMYVCHFGKERIYYSAMRQFIETNNDYQLVKDRFLAYSTVDNRDNLIKVTFSEGFPNSIIKDGRIHQCVELNDGGLLVEVENGEPLGNGCYVRQIYKICKFLEKKAVNNVIDIPQSNIIWKLTYINPLKVSPRTIRNSKGLEFTSSFSSGVKLMQCWGISCYESIVVMAGYDICGRNACVYYSEDNFETVKLIFNGASDSIQVNIENVPIGFHPNSKNILPSHSFDWNETGNGNVHVHGVCYDPYYERIWITTGDGGSLNKRVTGIFYTDDFGYTWHFVRLDRFGFFLKKSTQLLSIIPMKDNVLFTTDGYGDGFYRYKRNGKYNKVTLKYAYGYTGERTTLCTIAAGSCYTQDGGIITVFPYGKLTPDILSKIKCGLVYTNDGYSFQVLLQEKRPVGNVEKSVIHRRSIIRDYDGEILCSSYNGGYVSLKY